VVESGRGLWATEIKLVDLDVYFEGAFFENSTQGKQKPPLALGEYFNQLNSASHS